MNHDENSMLELLSEKINALQVKEEAINHLSLELMATTQRQNELRNELQTLQKKYKKFKRLQDEIEKEGSVFQAMLEKLVDSQDKLTHLTARHNYLEKENEMLKKKVHQLNRKIEFNIYEELNESDEKIMEKKDKEKTYSQDS